MSWLFRALLFALVLLCSTSALAGDLRVKGGAPVELRPETSGYGAKVTLENTGKERVKIDQVLVRTGTDPADPRVPSGVTVRFSGGGLSAVINPGETRDLDIDWDPVKGRPAHEFYGHVLVRYELDLSPPLVIGIHSAPDAGSWKSVHPLLLLCLMPLVGLILVLYLRTRTTSAELVKKIVGGVAMGQTVLLALLAVSFDVGYTRFEGGDGLQFIDRIPLSRSIGLEWFVALDGLSLPLILLVAVLLMLASRMTGPSLPRSESFWAWMLALDAGLVTAFLARDLAFLFGGVVLALVSTVAVVSLGAKDGPRAARGLGLHLGIASLLVGFALWSLSQSANPLYLIDGNVAGRSFTLTELAHGGWAPLKDNLLGAHSVKVIYGALFLGSALILGAPPFHGWLTAVVTRSPTPLALFVGGAVPALGAYLLLRVGFAAIPDGSAWAAGGVGLFGLLGALHVAFASLSSDDLKRLAIRAASAHSGLVLLALGSLTAMGVQGAVLSLVARGLGIGGMLVIAAVIEERVHTTKLDRLGGVGGQLPVFGMLAAGVFVAVAAGAGTLSFLGFFGTLGGVLPSYRVLGIVTPLIGALLAVALARAYSRVFLGSFPDHWPKSRFLEPHAGKLPLLEERELGVLVAVFGLLVVLGFWPSPLGRIIDASALDQAQYPNPPGALEVVQSEVDRSERVASR
jgi:NADH-quinone oxidoreductase subunit M